MTYTGVPPFQAEPSGGAASNVETLINAVIDIVGIKTVKAAA
jgi:hypothetical protein